MESIRWAFSFRNWYLKREEWMLCFSVIQPEEKDRISKFVFQKDVKASLAGRLLIRKLISQKLELPWSSFLLKRSEKGRPFLEYSMGKHKFDFNVSHQGKWAVLAAEFGNIKIGVDVMEIDAGTTKNVPEFFRLMRRQFTVDEWNVIKRENNELSQLKAFYRNWCLKEAFVKALGVGISYDLLSISFTPVTELTLGEVITDTKVRVNGTLDNSWCFEETLLDENHIATVAFQGPSSVSSNEKLFKVLSFEDLINNCEQLTFPDSELADATMKKLEAPNLLK